MQEQFTLDDPARLALDVAHHAALANGDSMCGTEYLLYGLVATARGDIVDLIELFALNTLRVDRAIERLVAKRGIDPMNRGRPILTARADKALRTPRLDGDGPTGIFEIFHGLLAEDASGACSVLRDLGVLPDEARRLVSYGIRHLSADEVEDLLRSLDRRKPQHRGWWGPNLERTIQPVGDVNQRSVLVATSETAEVELIAMGSDGEGLGFTCVVRSKRSWVLPPVFVPEEALVPGQGASYNSGPDFFLMQVRLPDGTIIDNRRVAERFEQSAPDGPRLSRIGQRDEHVALNDRRAQDQHAITGDWWIWPLPETGSIEIMVDWPAESISGSVALDISALLHP